MGQLIEKSISTLAYGRHHWLTNSNITDKILFKGSAFYFLRLLIQFIIRGNNTFGMGVWYVTVVWDGIFVPYYIPNHRTIPGFTVCLIWVNMILLKDLHFTFWGYWFSLLYGVIIHLVWAFGMVRWYGMGFSYHTTYQTTVPYQVLQYAVYR